jgi:hypothetical protein
MTDNTTIIAIAVINGSFALGTVCLTLIIKGRLDAVHRQINSRMDQLLDINKSASKAEGILEGKEAADINNNKK